MKLGIPEESHLSVVKVCVLVARWHLIEAVCKGLSS